MINVKDTALVGPILRSCQESVEASLRRGWKLKTTGMVVRCVKRRHVKIDLSEDFEQLKSLDFDSPADAIDYVLQKALKAMQSVVSLTIEELQRITPAVLNDTEFVSILPAEEFDTFMTQALVAQLSETLRLRASAKLMSAYYKSLLA